MSATPNISPIRRVGVYVDGFNLYRGCLQNSTYKWLDLERLANELVGHPVFHVRYFTAHVKGNPAGANRQNVYLRALGSCPVVRCHDDGTYMSHVVIRPVAATPHRRMRSVFECCAGPGQPWVVAARPCPREWLRASVVDTEEKGSDVNLASFLMLDAAHGVVDRAVVISGDSDLQTPIRLVRDNYIPVDVFNPTPNRPSTQLQSAASAYATVPLAALSVSQLPDPVQLPDGTLLRKPSTW